MVAEPFVDIVIPTWNGWKFLEPCLRSIMGQDFQQFTITVVDNGSTDGTLTFLQKLYPDVNVVSFSENKGFSAAVNAGIKVGGHPLVFLLNNDTELAPDCLGQLVQAAAQNKHQFFAAKMLSFHDRTLLDGAGDSYLRGGAGYRLGTLEPDGGLYDTQREVFGACAGAALYRRSFFETVGFFDEDFFAYLEDVDLNVRANLQGLRCLFVPLARVFHVGSATTGSKINGITVRLSTRNSFYVLLKNYSSQLFFHLLPAIVVYQTSWLFFCIKRGQFTAYLRGLVEVVPRIWTLRKKYVNSRKESSTFTETAALLCRAEGEVVDSIMRRRKIANKSNFLLLCYKKLLL